MRVKIAEHLRPARPRRAVGINQCLRVNLEMGVRGGVDIGSFVDVGDARTLAKQDAASLLRVRRGGGSAHGGKGLACHFDLHHAWP